MHIDKEIQRIIRLSLLIAWWNMEELLSFWTQKKTMLVIDDASMHRIYSIKQTNGNWNPKIRLIPEWLIIYLK